MTEYSQISKSEYEEEFREFCKYLLFRRFSHVQLYTGSCFELPLIYFLDKVTDIDVMAYAVDICAVSKDAKPPSNFKGTVLSIQSEETHIGYATLHFKHNNMPYSFPVDPEERPAKFKVVVSESDISTGLISTNFQGLSSDMVEAIWCPNWPEEANGWQLRERRNGWPAGSTVKRIVNNGCFLVAKPHIGIQLITNEWRFSFSEAELILIHTWNDVQLHIYHILRVIKNDVVRKCGGKKMTFLTTYHFKTLMLWACEEKSNEFWLPQNIESSVRELILVMIEWLINKQCRNYFMPGNNMLDHLPDDHDFEREVEFLVDFANLVYEYISSTVPFAGDGSDERYNEFSEFSVRMSTIATYFLHLRINFWYVIDPSRPGRQMYDPGNAIEKSHVFKSEVFKLFQCLTSHRRFILAKDFEEKLGHLHKVEDCFRGAREREVDDFTYFTMSPMDNFHVIIAKLLKKGIDSSDDVQHLKSSSPRGNSSRRALCYSRNESVQRSYVACAMDTIVKVMHEEIVKPSRFHTAAYEANFYWTMFREDVTLISCAKALEICVKWLSSTETMGKSFSLNEYFATRQFCGLPVVISNRWSVIFDEYIQIVLGFLSLVKSIKPETRRVTSDSNTNLNVVVLVHAVEFLGYIYYQCDLHLKDHFKLNQSLVMDMPDKITFSSKLLQMAARISSESRRII